MKKLLVAAALLVPALSTMADIQWVFAPLPIPVPVITVRTINHRPYRIEQSTEYDHFERGGSIVVRRRWVEHNITIGLWSYGPWEIDITVCGQNCPYWHDHVYLDYRHPACEQVVRTKHVYVTHPHHGRVVSHGNRHPVVVRRTTTYSAPASHCDRGSDNRLRKANLTAAPQRPAYHQPAAPVRVTAPKQHTEVQRVHRPR